MRIHFFILFDDNLLSHRLLNVLIINNCENTTFFVMQHIRILLYNKSIIYFIRCFNTYHFNSSTFILTENIEPNTIKRHINNTFDTFFQ